LDELTEDVLDGLVASARRIAAERGVGRAEQITVSDVVLAAERAHFFPRGWTDMHAVERRQVASRQTQIALTFIGGVAASLLVTGLALIPSRPKLTVVVPIVIALALGAAATSLWLYMRFLSIRRELIRARSRLELADERVELMPSVKGYSDAGLMSAWFGLELLLREAASGFIGETSVGRLPPSRLVRYLVQGGRLTSGDAEDFEKVLAVRNEIAHGGHHPSEKEYEEAVTRIRHLMRKLAPDRQGLDV